MKVGYLQFCPFRFAPEKNIEFIGESLRGCEADLIVLPEMALTGYLFPGRKELERYSEPIPGPSFDKITEIAKQRDLYIVCGIAEKSGGKIYNSAFLTGPEGLVGLYRKSHLFLDEKKKFDRGDTGFKVYEVRGAKVGILICFDWIFPEAARSLALEGAEIIAHPANLVLNFAQNAVVTRCIENRLFWILANRTGTEQEAETRFNFTGRSRIVSPSGKVITQSCSTANSLSIVEVDVKEADDKNVTPFNHLFRDRRVDLYKN